MERVRALAGKGYGIPLYFPESFEWLRLSCDIFKDKDLAHMLENTADYAASEIYGS